MKTKILLLTTFLAISTMVMASDYTKNIAKALDGDVHAQFVIAYCYYYGKGVKQDYTQAASWYRKAAEQGHIVSQARLGDCYYKGQGVKQDYSQALYWWRKAAAQGEITAKYKLKDLGEDLYEQPAEQSDFQKYMAAAKQGNADAQCMMGYYYYKGEGVTQDYTQAVYWYQKAAEQGQTEAQWRLGHCYYAGEGVSQDYDQAAYWFRKAADQGQAWSQYLIGICYYNGQGVKQNTEMALYWWRLAAKQGHEESKKLLSQFGQDNESQPAEEESDYQQYIAAAKQGDAEAQGIIGYCYYTGKGVAKDYSQAVYWYRKAAEQGDVISQFNLGLCYSLGNGVTQDKSQTFYWYLKAAEQGYAIAQYNIGVIYYNGEGVTQDYAQAVSWWRKAAEQGHAEAKKWLSVAEEELEDQEPTELSDYQKYMAAAKQGDAEAQFKIGICYDKGKGVSQDYVQAVFWYRKAAEQGHAKAQNSIGNCYDTGEGVDQDFVQAVYWYRKSAEQGFMKAYLNLAYCYFMGRGVAKDLTQAVYWYRKAAEQGSAPAQCALGCLYYNGEGVTQDYAQAVAWFRKAADQGDENAKEFLSMAEDALKNQQLAEQNNKKQENLATIEWLNFASTVNQKEYQLKLGIKSSSKIEDVSITVNGSQSRGINTVKSDGYDQTINRTLALSEGTNNIVVSVRNADGTATSTKVVTYQANTAVQEVSQGKRIALVMGNSNYTNSSALKNPVNDATDVAKKLEALGFTVIRSLDQSKRGMETAINDFGVKAQGYDVALFFYAGHGISYNGSNYMIPIDANLAAEEDVQYDCTNARRVLDKMEKANCKMKIMILDACRDLPSFARGWHRSVGDSGGFNRMDAPKGTFIAYATAEGDVAQDGKGRNSPFTTALLQTLDIPNLSITELFQEVGDKVVTTTNEKQNPWTSSSFRGKFIFNQK